jgi:putative FmdB family regulatory protein
MPLYDYSCRKCQHEFQALIFPGEEPECPLCQSHQLERLLNVPARPAGEKASLPMGCDPSLPPCGPACRRFNGS